MKFNPIILLFIVSTHLLNCSGEQKGRMEGVWELVTATYTSPDTTLQFDKSNWVGIKVITKSHFIFVGQVPNRSKVSGDFTDAELISMAQNFFGGGGIYTLNGDTYTEKIQYFLNPNYITATLPWKIEINGTQLIQSGTYPAKSIGLEQHDFELYEVYRKIE